jgi:hypothetical protein
VDPGLSDHRLHVPHRPAGTFRSATLLILALAGVPHRASSTAQHEQIGNRGLLAIIDCEAEPGELRESDVRHHRMPSSAVRNAEKILFFAAVSAVSAVRLPF